VLDDGFEAGMVQLGARRFGGMLTWVRPNLYVIESVAIRRHDEGRKILLLKGVRHCQRVTLMTQRRNLEHD